MSNKKNNKTTNEVITFVCKNGESSSLNEHRQKKRHQAVPAFWHIVIILLQYCSQLGHLWTTGVKLKKEQAKKII